jgi:limonene-1,2-epoxide hydrolase
VKDNTMTVSISRRIAFSVVGLTAAAAALASIVPAQATSAPTVSTTEHTLTSSQHHQNVPTIAQDWATAWNSTDTTLLAKLFTSHGVYTDYALGKTMTGHQEITAWKVGTDQRIADVHVTILNAFQDGDHIAIEATYAGHVNGAPTPFAVPITTILDLDHGKIATNHDNYSLSTVLAQSGLPADTTSAPTS